MKSSKKLKCPWCGRHVGFSSSNRLEPHVQSGRVKCVGAGQPRHQVEWLREQKDKGSLDEKGKV